MDYSKKTLFLRVVFINPSTLTHRNLACLLEAEKFEAENLEA